MATLSHQKPLAVLNPLPFQALPNHLCTRQAIRILEQQHSGLMGKAAQAIIRAMSAMLARRTPAHSAPPLIFCAVGPGNNGGDVLMAIPQMLAEGWQVRLWQQPPPHSRPADSAEAWQALQPWREHPLLHIQQNTPMTWADDYALIVDGLYGMGYQPARPPSADAAAQKLNQNIHQMIGAINAYRLAHPHTQVLAVDIPSGLCADNGWRREDLPELQSAVVADVTLALLANKAGYYQSAAPSLCGQLCFDDLGVSSHTPITTASINLNTRELWQAQLPKRRSEFHKGMGGEVVVVGGCAPMWGAGLLSCEAALALGAGRVYGWNHQPPLQPPPWLGSRPEIIQGMPRDGLANKVVLLGPGLGVDDHARQTLALLFNDAGHMRRAQALVWDADALPWLFEHPHVIVPDQEVLTPHPLEAARLLGHTSAKSVQQDRLGAADALARRYQRVVVLKGCGTIVAVPSVNPQGLVSVHLTINPGAVPALGTAGTGDVLAGAIAALMAQGMNAQMASVAAVWLHNQAGMKLMHQQGRLMARELIPEMRQIIHELED